jgi:asparagine synthase (glutamine-hydrolysing)
MSGIVGLIMLDGTPADRELLGRLTDFQRFRGPDGQGLWTDGPVGLGHTLLQTTEDDGSSDLPCSLNGEIWITADARVDERGRLIAELQQFGTDCPCYTSDAQLLLHAYATWREECLAHIRGDFSFAIWDRPRRRLFGAVDPFRIKPFFYATVGRALVFSNSLDCLQLHPNLSGRLDETAVGDFLAFGHYRTGDLTIFADVRRLQQAHILVVENGRVRTRQYWFPPQPQELSYREPQELKDRFLKLLDESVEDRLRTSCVAISLSGGLDSPLLAWRLLEHKKKAPALNVRAFTAVFERLIPDPEKEYAKLVSGALGLPTTFVPVDDFTLYDWTATCDRVPPEPLHMLGWDWTLGYARRLAGVSRVELTGLDGDLLLKADLPAHWRGLWRASQLKRLVREVAWYAQSQRGLPPIGFRSHVRKRLSSSRRNPNLPGWFNRDWAQRNGLEDRWREAHLPRPSRNEGRGIVWDHITSPIWSSVFDAFDPGWTGLPLESRHPLMDMRVLVFLANLPTIPWCVNKEFFRTCLDGTLPKEVLKRPKTVLRGNPFRAKFQGQRENWEKNLALEPEIAYFIDTARFPVLQSLSIDQANWDCFLPYSLNHWLKLRKKKVERHATS